MAITVVPTLAFMADVYRRPAAVGPQSGRFTHYVAAAAERLPVHGYNPMTSTPVLPTVEALLAVDAESILAAAAGRTAAGLGHDGDLAMHVTVATPGMWTDRIGTEVEHRLLGADAGGLLWWFDQPVTPAAVEAEAVAQTARLVAGLRRGGPPATLADAVEQEGRALALAGDPGERDPAAAEVLEVLGTDASLSSKVAFLHGDEAARAMGFTPLGLGDRAGYRHAAALAHPAPEAGTRRRRPAPGTGSVPCPSEGVRRGRGNADVAPPHCRRQR